VHVIPREGGTGNCTSPRSTRAGSGAATAAALIVSPYLSATLTRAPGKSFKPALHDGVEHRLRVIERIADDLQDFRRRRLLLERFR